MVTETALMGIACLLNGATPEGKTEILNGLNLSEIAVVEKLQPLCIPENLKAMLEAGSQELKEGAVNDDRQAMQPTRLC